MQQRFPVYYSPWVAAHLRGYKNNMPWLTLRPHPDDMQYRQVSLHCYQADRRKVMADELDKLSAACNKEAEHLELRLAGKLF